MQLLNFMFFQLTMKAMNIILQVMDELNWLPIFCDRNLFKFLTIIMFHWHREIMVVDKDPCGKIIFDSSSV